MKYHESPRKIERAGACIKFLLTLSILLLVFQPGLSKADDILGNLTPQDIGKWLIDMGVLTLEKAPAIDTLLEGGGSIPGTTTNWLYTLATLYYITKWHEDWQNCQSSMVMYNALTRASLFTFSKSLSAIGFGAVASTAGLAATAIKMGLDSFLKGVIDDAVLHNEIMYERAIAMGYDRDFILRGKGNDDIIFTDDGWIYCVLDGGKCFSKAVLGRTPFEVYTTIATGEEYCQSYPAISAERDQLLQVFVEELTTTASFAANPIGGKVPLNVTFDGLSSTPEEGLSIVSWQWNFGDPGSNDLNDAEGAIVNHEFHNPGDYQATLTVTDSAANTSTATKTLKVTSPVHADFSISPDHAIPGTEIEFESHSYDENGEIVMYRWTFGDGHSESGEDLTSVAHTYNDENYYVVTLQATGSSGYTDTIKKAVPIGYGGPTYVSGYTIDSQTTWSAYYSPYILTGSISIAKSGRLIVEPGTTVEINPGLNISVYGILDATGVTFTNAKEGENWGGIYFYEEEAGSSRLENCIFEGSSGYTSASPYSVIRMVRSDPVITGCTFRNCSNNGISLNDSSPTITNNTITGMSGNGIYIDEGSSPTVTGNAFSINAKGVLVDYHYDKNNNPLISGNTYSENGDDIYLYGNIGKTVTAVWNDTGNYRIGNSLSVSGILEIVDSTTVGIYKGLNISIYGILDATGVTFTNAKEGENWGGIYFYEEEAGSSRLENCIFEGSSGYTSASPYSVIRMVRSDPVITGCTFRNCSNNGISLNDSSPTITNNTITGMSGNGIYVDEGSSPTVTGNAFSSNAKGVLVDYHYDKNNNPLISGNTYSENGDDIYLYGNIGKTVTAVWNDTGNYRIGNSLSVSGILEIVDSTTVGIYKGLNISIYGILDATGVTFTNAKEGENWGGIYFYEEEAGSSRLENCIFEGSSGYTSASPYSVIRMVRSDPVITGCTFRNCSNNGISLNDSSPTITNNTITGMSGNGIYIDEGSSPTVTGNAFSSNAKGVLVDYHYDKNNNPLISGNTYSENGDDIYLYGNIGKPSQPFGMTLEITESEILYQSLGILEIVDSTTVGIYKGLNISIYGILDATGVTFTNAKEGENWGGIYFYEEEAGSSRLENCIFEGSSGYTSASPYSVIHMVRSDPVITGCTFRNCSNNGISLNDSSPTITNNTITGMSGNGIYVDEGSSPTVTGNAFSINAKGVLVDYHYDKNNNPLISGEHLL